jgi:hypothetical protein
MTRILFAGATFLGAAAIIWMGADFLGTDALAFTVTVVIGCAYLIGILELYRYRQATASLAVALNSLPVAAGDDSPAPTDWVKQLHPSLQNPVRLRIEGEAVALPAPIITPYLVGLLVMLGLLGTFVGMVDTLQGAVAALEGSTELEAIRNGLAAPIAGLGVAFGTSVAGIAASAMLGLNATLSRRERLLAARQLERCIGTVFRQHSLTYQRQETYKALQQQADALPAVAQQLAALAGNLEHMGERLTETLLANQNQFHQSATAVYTELADSVDKTLKQSLADYGKLAGEHIAPLVESTMAGVGRHAEATQQHLTDTAREQLEAVSTQLAGTLAEIITTIGEADSERLQRWTDTLATSQAESSRQLTNTAERFAVEINEVAAAQKNSIEAVSATQEATIRSASETQQTTIEAASKAQQHSLQTASAEFQSLTETLNSQWLQAGEQSLSLQDGLAESVNKASQLLREGISNNIERDNALLEERRQVLEDLNTLSGSLQQSSTEQREAVAELVTSSTSVLKDVSAGFGEHVSTQASTLSEISANFAGSATEMSSLGEAFTLAVQLFSESNQNLIENLGRIEASMDTSTTRSDEQMAYYVAQAREIIDQSMLSQREVIEELKQLGRTEDLFEAEAS